jgi:N-methylhydantoinase B
VVRGVDSIAPDEVVEGPAIIESSFTTVVIEPGARAQKSNNGGVSIAPGSAADPADGPEQPMPESATFTRRVTRPRPQSVMGGVELALITNRFQTIVRKMTNTLFRTARSGVINSARDFSCCILTADSDLLAAAESLPIHIMRGPDLMAQAMKEYFPILSRGDAFLNNSPYHGNSHAGDHAMLAPVIDDDGIHRYTVCVKAHVADCGNSRPSSYVPTARDVYEEGALLFPCVKVQDKYETRMDIVHMCEMRIRVPEQWWGDYLGFLGALRIGEREVLTLGQELGWEVLTRYERDWFDYSENRMVESIKHLPSGTVTSGNSHDPFPGAPDGVPITARVSVDAERSTITVDLRENPDCLPNGLNLTEATAHTAGMIGIFNSIDHTTPANAGSFRRLRILLRENCVAGIPRHPASCSLATTGVADRVANAVQRGLAEIGDGAGMAEAGLCIPASSAVISGRDPRRGDARFVNMLILGQTGGAGGPHEDAWLNVAHVGNAGLMLRDSTEVDELRHPVRIWVDEIVPDTEGAGKFRGAPAARVEYGPVDCSIEALWSSDGSANPALGARGGLSGARATQFKRVASGELVELDPWGDVTVAPDETIVSTSCGGGGYGSPLDRDPERVRRDLAEGWVTRARALAVYGVVIDGEGQVDHAATLTQRERLAGNYHQQRDDWKTDA